MKVIIAGGRDYIPTPHDKGWLIAILDYIDATTILCGMAKGADTFGYNIGKELNIPINCYPANWNKYGKSAGYIRNEEMARNADICILFKGGKGTMHMYNLAMKYNLRIIKRGW